MLHDAVMTILSMPATGLGADGGSTGSGGSGGELLGPLGQLGGSLILYVLTAIANWPIYAKAGYAGWTAFVPILNIYLLLKIVKFHGAMVLLYLIPLVNIVLALIVALRLGRIFGRSTVFSVFLLWLLAPIGQFIVGYGRSQHHEGVVADWP
ncbi:DUF5684 domain-containing protein [Schumannella soli]|uniref:Signal peptidase I n=1 Tax=Schumannella soli TaxID=2590779 RepID=A0A506YAY6_9MICO|nr:DUF5684 domain-containing protein [Schumannella soli]TPW77639.1 hypothetical protein FJ657_02965 [Schumannella soli]